MTPSEEAWLYQVVGDRVRRARNRAGLTQMALAEDLDVSRASVVNIEKGRQRPPLHLLWSLAERLGLEAVDLIPTQEQLAHLARQSGGSISPTLLDRIHEEAENDTKTVDQLTAFVETSRVEASRNESKAQGDALGEPPDEDTP